MNINDKYKNSNKIYCLEHKLLLSFDLNATCRFESLW